MRATLAIGMVMVGCGGVSNSPATPEAESAVQTEAIRLVLADWHEAATAGDEQRYFSHLAPDAIFLGPDGKQRWDVDALRAYAVPRYGEKGFPIQSLRHHVLLSHDGREAWLDEDLQTQVLGPARGTGWMKRFDDGRWRIVRYSLVLTVPEGRIGEVRRLLAEDR